jgi:hypothetical protein
MTLKRANVGGDVGPRTSRWTITDDFEKGMGAGQTWQLTEAALLFDRDLHALNPEHQDVG